MYAFSICACQIDVHSLTFDHLFAIAPWFFSFEWSRFIFFEKEKGSKCFLEDSFKESRKQLCAVATALHLPEEDAAEYIVNTAFLTFVMFRRLRITRTT